MTVIIVFIKGSGNTSQKSDEDDFVKVDDLQLQLTVMCEVCTKKSVHLPFKAAQTKDKLKGRKIISVC